VLKQKCLSIKKLCEFYVEKWKNEWKGDWASIDQLKSNQSAISLVSYY